MRFITWGQLLSYHKNPPLNGLYRSVEIQNKYSEILKKGIPDLEKYLFCDDECIYKITNNDFPYYVEQNISHKVLWLNPKFTVNDQMIKKFTDYSYIDEIINKEAQGKQYVYFRNLPNNSSIPTIIHYQVFINNI